MNLSFIFYQTAGVVQAGDELSGLLIINSSKPIKGTHFELYFTGKEYTKVEYKNMDGDSRTNHGNTSSCVLIFQFQTLWLFCAMVEQYQGIMKSL